MTHTIRYKEIKGTEFVFCPDIQDAVEHESCRKCNQFAGYSKSFRNSIVCNLSRPLIDKPESRLYEETVISCKKCPALASSPLGRYFCRNLKEKDDYQNKSVPTEVVVNNGIYKDCPLKPLSNKEEIGNHG